MLFAILLRVVLLGFWANDSIMARASLIKLYLDLFQTKISLLEESMRRAVEQMCRSVTFNRFIV